MALIARLIRLWFTRVPYVPMTFWHVHHFDDLSPAQLYLLMQLRQDVFVVEQKCAFVDLDGNDFLSIHLSERR